MEPVFDEHIQSIGDVTIDQRHPDTVWVGTGETWTRNSVGYGNGIYVTYNGGDDWKHMGLGNTRRIQRVLVHPKDPQTIYVAALGHLFGPNKERGVYRSTDGGKTWEKVLYVDDLTGCSELALDPSDPDILYAGMWHFWRKPWFFQSGGQGSALYRTTDGGENWKELEKGLPKDDTLGRVSVAVSPIQPNIVYALMESDSTGLYRSSDRGDSWKKVNSTSPVVQRPFYFFNIYPDPQDTGRVYKPGFNLAVSKDSGNTFGSPGIRGSSIHPDHHAMHIDPQDNDNIYIGTDGGVYFSRDKGNTWNMIRDLPVSTYYHVSVDNERPYRVYGGLQDNGSWIGPSASGGGINNWDWKNVGGGDGFYCYPDKENENIIYYQSQGGNISRHYKNTNESKNIQPHRSKGEEELRFNWDTPAIFSDDGKRMYIGAQYLFRTSNKGDSWKRISPDLTTDDPAKQNQEESGGLTIDNSKAENHCTIVTIDESPHDKKVIWVGTDDGNLQLTRNGGESWKNVVDNIPGLPDNTWCSYVESSPHKAGTAFVTFDGHKNGDFSSYLYKTTDHGESWKAIADTNVKGYCHVIRQDPEDPDLLYLGTELGLYFSMNGGKRWTRFKGNLPKVSIRDMVFQKRENDLVMASHGRGVLIVDDLTPLRDLEPADLNSPVAYLSSKPLVKKDLSGGLRFNGDADFVGDNPPQAAQITYYLKKRHIFGEFNIEIFNEEGEKVKTLAADSRKGINRVSWNLRRERPKVPKSPSLARGVIRGPSYAAGTYTVKLNKGDSTYKGQVTIKNDPRSPHSKAAREKQHETVMKAYHLLEDLAYLDHKVKAIRDQADSLSGVEKVRDALQDRLRSLRNEMDSVHKKLTATKTGGITGEQELRGKVGSIYGDVMGYKGRPTDSQIERLNNLEQTIRSIESDINEWIDTDLADLNEQIQNKDVGPISIPSREAFESGND